jgi:anaerobic magnesium-protoporphyrin IX monomethyl ester cyclase
MSNMRFVLIRPPVLMPAFNMADLIVPPIGPAYIAAALREAGHTVLFLDAVGLAIEQYTKHERNTLLHGLTFDEIVDRIPALTDCIGVSTQFSFEWPVCRKLLQKIRQRFPETLLIAGGEHVTAVPEFSLADSPLDAIIVGEGENTACELLKAYQAKGRQGLVDVPGLWFKDGAGRCQRTASAARIKELEKIPRPAWDLLPLEEYLSRGYGFGVARGRSVPVLASRGCPYQCTFCSNPTMWTTRWKARDPNDLLDEIADLQKTYSATNFDFYDLTMIVKKEWIIDFCHAIENRHMQFTWQLPSGTRSEAVDKEVTHLLFRTGCRNISYSPESGSNETLKQIKKRVSLHRLMKSMRQSVRNHLNVKCNFIFGFPHERWKNILESFGAILRSAIIGIHDISIWVFVPYPGSELFVQLRSRGKIKELDDDYFNHLAAYADITKTFSYCERLSKAELIFARSIGIFFFYFLSWLLRPWRPVQIVYHSMVGRLESRSELALRGFFRRFHKWVAQN